MTFSRKESIDVQIKNIIDSQIKPTHVYSKLFHKKTPQCTRLFCRETCGCLFTSQLKSGQKYESALSLGRSVQTRTKLALKKTHILSLNK